MTDESIRDYAKIKHIESNIINALKKKMSYLYSIRESIEFNLKEINEMIQEIEKEVFSIMIKVSD
jgi:hypothetical protein